MLQKLDYEPDPPKRFFRVTTGTALWSIGVAVLLWLLLLKRPGSLITSMALTGFMALVLAWLMATVASLIEASKGTQGSLKRLFGTMVTFAIVAACFTAALES